MLTLSFLVEEKHLLHQFNSNNRQNAIDMLECLEDMPDKELQATAQSTKRKVLGLSDREFKEFYLRERRNSRKLRINKKRKRKRERRENHQFKRYNKVCYYCAGERKKKKELS